MTEQNKEYSPPSSLVALTSKLPRETVDKLEFIHEHLGVTKSALVSRLVDEGIDVYLQLAIQKMSSDKVRKEIQEQNPDVDFNWR